MACFGEFSPVIPEGREFQCVSDFITITPIIQKFFPDYLGFPVPVEIDGFQIWNLHSKIIYVKEEKSFCMCA